MESEEKNEISHNMMVAEDKIKEYEQRIADLERINHGQYIMIEQMAKELIEYGRKQTVLGSNALGLLKQEANRPQ